MSHLVETIQPTQRTNFQFEFIKMKLFWILWWTSSYFC